MTSEIESLRNQLGTCKHHWYIHGLPKWPLPYQAMTNTTTPEVLPIPKKSVDWPNYGMAMLGRCGGGLQGVLL